MSAKNSKEEQSAEKHSSGLNKTDETVYNPVKKEERKQKAHDEDEMEEFNSWAKKYNFLSKEIRKNAIEQERQELENLKKSPMTKYKYFVGSREERIQQLDEEKKLLDEMENLAKSKDKKKIKKLPEKSASTKETKDGAEPTDEEETEDPEFRKMRKEYHETSKELRRKSLHLEKSELTNKQQKDTLDYVPGSPKDRVKNIGGEVSNLEKIQKLKAEKDKKKKEAKQ